MYKVDIKSGRIFDAKGEEVPQDDRDDRFLTYLLWLSGDRAPEIIDVEPSPPSPAEELAAARAWGSALVDNFMVGALASGVNERGLAGPCSAGSLASPPRSHPARSMLPSSCWPSC